MAKKSTALSVNVVSSYEKPPMQIRLNRWTFGLFLIVALVVTGLASITVYNFLDTPTNRYSGDNMSYAGSSSTREQEQEKLIKLGQDRLVELQQENDARKKDVDDLQTRVGQLSDSLKSLQTLAQEVEARLPGGGTGTNPQTTPTGSLPQSSGGLGGGNTAYHSFDAAEGRAYADQYSQVAKQLDDINNSIKSGQLNISTLDIQVESYQAALQQQKDILDHPASLDSSGSNPPNSLPANCVLTSPFGMRQNPFVPGTMQMHYGIDIGCFEGTPVAVTKDGVVSFVGYDSGYGNRVEVTHAGGWLTLYGHNNRILVKVGQVVKKGDIIALSGNTGASTGPHIHYELHENGVAIDPAKLMAVPLVFQK